MFHQYANELNNVFDTIQVYFLVEVHSVGPIDIRKYYRTRWISRTNNCCIYLYIIASHSGIITKIDINDIIVEEAKCLQLY